MTSNVAIVQNPTMPVSNKATMPTSDIFADPAVFEHFQRVAKVFASSNLVPQHLRGNVADCVIALAIARRLNEDPLTIFQSIYIVNGKPGWLTSYLIARANRAGVFRSPITWDESGSGDTLSVTARAILAGTGEEVKTSADMRMARAEGWTKNPKYQSMGAHMLKWRSAAMLIRLYCPEIMFGLPAVEELETLPAAPRDITPATERMKKTLDEFAAGIKTDAEPEQEAQEQESCLAPPAPGQGAPSDSADPPLAPPGAPAATPSESPQQGRSASSPAAATAPAPAERASKAGAGAPSFKSEAEYVEHANAWIDETEDPDLIEMQWRGEKTLRNKANVTLDVRDGLAAKAQAKMAKLRGQAS